MVLNLFNIPILSVEGICSLFTYGKLKLTKSIQLTQSYTSRSISQRFDLGPCDSKPNHTTSKGVN